MHTLTFNIYKQNQFKRQEHVLLRASKKVEAKQKALKLPDSTHWAIDFTINPDLHTIKPYLNLVHRKS